MIAIQPSVEIVGANEYSVMLEKIERIGRVCYKSEDAIRPGSAEPFIQGILRRGHESVIEHESISVRVICDRGVSHEIVRHRLASYSQESTRYCNYTREKFSGQLVCIDIASGFRYDLSREADQTKYAIWTQAMEAAERFYFQLIAAGARPEEARSVLPNSLKTELVMTMNLREWRHFLRLRTSHRAHPQIAEAAGKILTLFAEQFPVFFADLERTAE